MSDIPQHIAVDAIIPGDNDRKTFDQTNLEQLAGDIARAGRLINPITVRPTPDGRYQIVAGERRWRAHLLLGWNTIAAFVRDDMSDEEADLIMLSENIQRVDLNVMEQAEGFRKQIERYGRSRQDVADICSVSLDLVRRRLGLLELISDVQQMVRTGNLKVGHAECLIGLDANNQISAIQKLNEKPIDQKGFKTICDELLERQLSCTMFDLDALFVELRDEYEREKETRKRSNPAALQKEIKTLKAALAAERERNERLEAALAAEQAERAERERLEAALAAEQAERAERERLEAALAAEQAERAERERLAAEQAERAEMESELRMLRDRVVEDAAERERAEITARAHRRARAQQKQTGTYRQLTFFSNLWTMDIDTERKAPSCQSATQSSQQTGIRTRANRESWYQPARAA